MKTKLVINRDNNTALKDCHAGTGGGQNSHKASKSLPVSEDYQEQEICGLRKSDG